MPSPKQKANPDSQKQESVLSATKMQENGDLWERWMKMCFHNWRDSCRKADNRMKKSISADIFKHALHRKTVDSEGDAGSGEVKAAANDIIVLEEVRERGAHSAAHTA